MNDRPPVPLPVRKASAASGEAPPFHVTRDDVYFILFRRKWLIAGLSLLGLVGALLTYSLQPSVYRSQAKLLVRYVVDSRGTEVGMDGQVRAPSAGGDSIINSEIEILTSLDLCEQAASAIGLEKVLGRPASTNESLAAGVVLKRGLEVEVPRRSNVIKISMRHGEREVAVRSLGQLVDAYLRRHVEVHRAVGAFDTVLSQQTDQFRTRLAETERQLRQLKTNFAGASLEDARRVLTEQLSRIRQDMFLAEAQLAETIATGGRDRTAAINTNALSTTNTVPLVAAATNSAVLTNLAAAGASAPPATVSEYRSLCARIATLQSRELDLISLYTDENPLVKRTREQMADTEVRKRLLEKEHPALLSLEAAATAAGTPLHAQDAGRPLLAGLQARLGVLSNQLSQVRAEIASLDNAEGEILRLQRTKALEERNYSFYAAGIEQARFNEVIAGGKQANISVIEAPTPPVRDKGSRSKMAGAILMAGILGGFGLAFLLELLLDRTMKRPGDVEDRLHLPLFASIPQLTTGMRKALPNGAATLLAIAPEGGDSAAPKPAIWSPGHPMKPYFEAMRDRTLLDFEGVTRKPKLLGVTGCGRGNGVTTIAVGLAAALSETGCGNVLLVDLKLGHDSIHPFFNGRPGCGLADAVENDRRETGLVANNLYLALACSGAGQDGDSLPMRLAQIVPRLRLSDYDYIVFDMPGVTQTGITARLAGMMDLVLMVVESGKHQREDLQRALALLKGSGARVEGVLNKVESYVPQRFRSQFYESAAAI